MNKKEIFIKNIYKDINEISDIKMQNEYWLGKSNIYTSSYTELMCRLFDEDKFDLFVEVKANEYGISENLIYHLEKLRNLLNNYVEKDRDDKIINDTEWRKVIAQATIIIEKWDINF